MDCNPAQSALLELKQVAIRQLEYEDVWALFGEGRVRRAAGAAGCMPRRPLLPAGGRSPSRPAPGPSVVRPQQCAHPLPCPCPQHPRAAELFERELAPYLSQSALKFWRPRLRYFKENDGLYFHGGMVRAPGPSSWGLSWGRS